MRSSSVFGLLLLALAVSVGVSFGQTSVVNGASFDSSGPIAPGSFATVLARISVVGPRRHNWTPMECTQPCLEAAQWPSMERSR